MRSLLRRTLLALLFLTVATACRQGGPEPGARKLQLVTTLFPLYDFARTVGGDKVEVKLLLPPGVEPHSFEPKPEDVVRINKADLFIFSSRYMEPWAEDILKGADKKGHGLTVEAGAGATFLPECLGAAGLEPLAGRQRRWGGTSAR